MKNKIGISVHPWYLLGNLQRLEEELETIEQAGADTCELVLHGLDVVVGGRIIPSRMAALQKILSRHALLYTLHLPYDLNLLDEDAAALYAQVFLAGIDFAKETDCSVIVYHAGVIKSSAQLPSHQEAEILDHLMKNIESIKVCMENSVFYREQDASCGKTAQGMIAMCQTVSHPNFGLTFDVGHSFINSNGEPGKLLADLQLLLPHIRHIHLHDNLGVPLPMGSCDYGHRIACGAGDIHLPLGWGSIPVPEVLTLLKGYDGIINLELEQRFEAQYAQGCQYIRSF